MMNIITGKLITRSRTAISGYIPVTLLPALMILFSLHIHALDSLRIGGIIIDKQNQPVANAKITLLYENELRSYEAFSDSKGHWEILKLKRGKVRIIIEKQGFITSIIMTEIMFNERAQQTLTSLEIRLMPIEFDGKKIFLSSSVPDQITGTNISDLDLDKANRLFKEGKFEAALALYLDYRAKNPGIHKPGIHIGLCFMELNRFDEALKELENTKTKLLNESDDVKKNKDLIRLYQALGNFYLRQSDYIHAEEYLKKAIESEIPDYTLPFNLAEVLFAQNKINESIQYYDLAFKLKPDLSKAALQLCYAYLNKGDREMAATYLNKYMELSPNPHDAEFLKDVLELNKKN